MITVIIHFHIKLEYIDGFLHQIQANAADRRLAPGNVGVQVFQEEEDSGQIIMIEIFDSQQHIDQYYNTENYLEWHRQTEHMIDRISGSDYRLIP